MPRYSKAHLAAIAEIEAEFEEIRRQNPPQFVPELAAMMKRDARQAELARAGAGFYICHHCYRDFLSLTDEDFCSRRCREQHGGAETDTTSSLPEETPEGELDDGLEDDTRVYDPRRGIYRTKSWTKWA